MTKEKNKATRRRKKEDFDYELADPLVCEEEPEIEKEQS